MKKIIPSLTHLCGSFTENRTITRNRAAYLLRAARSRRYRNVHRVENAYAITDCSYFIHVA